MTSPALTTGIGDPAEHPPHRSARRARLQVLVGWGGPILAAALLPGPPAILAMVVDPHPDAVIGAVVLGSAAITCYALVGWGLLVASVGLATRVPGRIGRAANHLLRRVAPAAIRRMLVTALGVTIVIGIGAPGAFAAVPGSTTPGNTTPAGTAADAGSPGAGPVTESAADTLLPFGLDWQSEIPDPQQLPAADPPRVATTDPAPQESPRGSRTESAANPGTADADGPAATGPRATTPTEPLGNAAAIPHPGAAETGAAFSTSADEVSPDRREIVTVAAGDCLWAIAARRLPIGASATQIDTAWRQWYAANRSVIGADPDMLIPGQRLHPPLPAAAAPAALPTIPAALPTIPGGAR